MLKEFNRIIETDQCSTVFKIEVKLTSTIASNYCNYRVYEFKDRTIACYDQELEYKLDFANDQSDVTFEQSKNIFDRIQVYYKVVFHMGIRYDP